MLSSEEDSTIHAKSALILGHTVTGMGEKTLALKFHRALTRAGYKVEPILDIVELLGDDYEPLAKLNYSLADADAPLMEDVKPPLSLPPCDVYLILSWCFSVAALAAMGIYKKGPIAAKLYAHHPNERVLPRLYEPAYLVMTESLLGNERACRYGIDPGKTLYLPHSYPAEYEALPSSRIYAQRLAEEQGKPLSQTTRIIGCVGRLECGKNFEWAVEAVRLLAERGEDVVLILKGDFPLQSSYPNYKPRFSEMLHTYRDAPWLLWDRRPKPYPQVLQDYASFDLLLHPSGAEGGSHVVVECLGLLKPVVLLDCSTNPFLFKGLATFVQTAPEIRSGQVPFYVPEMESLCRALMGKLVPPDLQEVQRRFHEKNLQERIPLLFDPDPKVLRALYDKDRDHYGL